MSTSSDKLHDAIQDVITDRLSEVVGDGLLVTGFVVTASVWTGDHATILTINSPEQSPATDYGLHKMGHEVAKQVMKSQAKSLMTNDEEDD